MTVRPSISLRSARCIMRTRSQPAMTDCALTCGLMFPTSSVAVFDRPRDTKSAPIRVN